MSAVRVTAVERVVRIVARGGTGVATINVEAPLATTGGATPTLSIDPATPSSPGSMSAADKAKLDALADPTLSDALPQALGNAGPGTSTRAARGDHVHAHGAQAGGGLHATATPLVAGFMSAADKTKLNSIAAGAQVNVPTNLGVGGTGDARTITSSTGSSAPLPLATATTAGLLSSFYFTLLSNFAANVRDQVLAMLQQGANITLTPSGTGASRTLTISSTASGSGGSGTVTSVGLSLPGIFTVSGSPVTGAGTLTATLASQTASRVWASPAGSDGAPTFRELVQGDIPALSASKIVLSDDRLLGQISGGSAATQISLGTGLSFAGTALTLSANLQGWNAIAPSSKQDALTAGAGITIVDNVISATAGPSSAAAVTYDNATSGLAATDVQAAIDEIEGRTITIADAQIVSAIGNSFALKHDPLLYSPTGGYFDIVAPSSVAASAHSRAFRGDSGGKWYFEMAVGGTVVSGVTSIGVAQASTLADASQVGSDGSGLTQSWGLLGDGRKYSGSAPSYGVSYAAGDVIMVAVDMSLSVGSRKIWWGKNGTWMASGDPVAGANEAFANLPIRVCPAVTPSTARLTLRLRSSEFSYSPPSGYSAWVS